MISSVMSIIHVTSSVITASNIRYRSQAEINPETLYARMPKELLQEQ